MQFEAELDDEAVQLVAIAMDGAVISTPFIMFH